MRIFYSMYIGYVFYYLTRKSVTFAMPSMINDLGFTMSDMGILSSTLSISYGISKFISGILADKSNPRYFMAFGLILTGVCNIFFGLTSSLWLLAIIWGINGLFQGWGWPPCARLLTYWYSQKERGKWWGTWSTAHSVGGFIIPIVAATICSSALGWRYALFIPGLLCIVMGFFLINRLRDTPQSMGLPSIEEFRGESYTHKEPPKGKNGEESSAKELLFHYVLRNKFIWSLAISYFFVYVTRAAINDWSQLYLMQTKSYSQLEAAFCAGFFEAGGIFGSLAAGFMSDRLFSGKRAPINILFCCGIVVSVLAFWLCPYQSIALDSLLTFIIGFLIFGPQMLIGMATAELCHKKAAGTATGFIGLIAYIGAASAGWPLGKITDLWGWGGFFPIIALCGVISILALIPLWNVKPYSEEEIGGKLAPSSS